MAPIKRTYWSYGDLKEFGTWVMLGNRDGYSTRGRAFAAAMSPSLRHGYAEGDEIAVCPQNDGRWYLFIGKETVSRED